MDLENWIITLAMGLAVSYIIWDIKRFQSKSEQEYKQFRDALLVDLAKTKEQLTNDATKVEKDLRAQMSMHSETLKAQAKSHRDDLHNSNGSLIYVTDAVCRDRMASCPAGKAILAFTDFDKKLDDMEDKWRLTRECFIKEISEIKTTLRLLLPKEPHL
jgi:hypothetical protein